MSVEVSVIVPVYNVEAYVEQCIASLKAQQAESFEVILVNDGSTDRSAEVCKAAIRDDDRFRLVHKKNGGLMSAWKEGLKHIRGQFVGFVDSDDWVEPDMFSVLLAEMKASGADVVASGFVRENPDSQVVCARPEREEFCGSEVQTYIRNMCRCYLPEFENYFVCRCDKLYRKEVLLQNLPFFDERVSLAEDFNTNTAVLPGIQKLVLLPNFAPYHYRNNPKSIVNTMNPRAFENLRALSESCDAIGAAKEIPVLYVDAFIGNILYEEVKRICRGPISTEARNALRKNLAMCNSRRYLTAYAQIRGDAVTTLSCRFIDLNWFSVLRFLLNLKETLHR